MSRKVRGCIRSSHLPGGGGFRDTRNVSVSSYEFNGKREEPLSLFYITAAEGFIDLGIYSRSSKLFATCFHGHWMVRATV